MTTGAFEHASLVQAAVAGDDVAFTRLYQGYGRSIFNMMLRSVRDEQLAEDLSQEVWLKAHRQLAKLREPAAFPTWLYRIAAKMCIDAARRRARRIDGMPLDDDAPSLDGDPERSAVERDDARRVWEALAILPAHQHLALFLREVEHRRYQEIGEILGISETAAGLCLFRGRRAFAAAYSRLEDRDPQGSCDAMRRLMSLRLDGQSTVVQDHALNVHTQACAGCRGEADVMHQAAQRYAGIFMAPIPLLLHDKILSASTAKAAATSGIGKLVGTLLAQTKTAMIAGSITVAAVGGAVVAPRAVAVVRGDTQQSAQAGTADAINDLPAAPAASDAAPAAVETGIDLTAGVPLPVIAPLAPIVGDVEALVPPLDQTLEDPVGAAEQFLQDAGAAVDETAGDLTDTVPAPAIPVEVPSLALTPVP